MCLYTLCHLIISLLNLFKFLLHLLVKIITFTYKYFKDKNMKQSELKEPLIIDDNKLFDLDDNDYSYTIGESNIISEIYNDCDV